MRSRNETVYPYMPNSVPETKEFLMKELGISSIEELFVAIPENLRFRGTMNLPAPLLAESDLKRHVESVMNRNRPCSEAISFLGAGCYDHYVPAICDEINGRAEFLTAYCGDTYSDHGKLQAVFEYTSMMGELLNMDIVSYTNYDGGQATASSLRMACRITGRSEVLVPATMNPEIFSQIVDYGTKAFAVTKVRSDPRTGLMDLQDLQKKLSPKVAAVLVENPSYLGVMEENAARIAELTHQHEAIFVVSADPSSLGVMTPPADYGADIACGDIQPLGMHMFYGGGCAGYIASRDEEKYVMQYPTYFYGILRGTREGEYGFGRALNHRCSHGSREEANEYFGTETGLWAITAAVYLGLMGPQGMRELGENILHKTAFLKKHLSSLKNVEIRFQASSFKETVFNFDKTGKTVAEINAALLAKNIYGGKDLSRDFPELGQSALYCVTENTTAKDIQTLGTALAEILA